MRSAAVRRMRATYFVPVSIAITPKRWRLSRALTSGKPKTNINGGRGTWRQQTTRARTTQTPDAAAALAQTTSLRRSDWVSDTPYPGAGRKWRVGAAAVLLFANRTRGRQRSAVTDSRPYCPYTVITRTLHPSPSYKISET